MSAQNIAWSAGAVPWMEAITEKTDGAVEFETFAGGELVELEGETYAIDTGVVDMAMVLPIYQPDQYPLTEVSMLPLSESDTRVGSLAWKEMVESEDAIYDGMTFHDYEYGSKGLKTLPLHTTPEYAISTSGRSPESIAALESLQLRTASRVHNIYANEVGPGSISIPNAETFDALSRGTFDGAFSSIADWGNYGVQDLYRYTLTGINFGHFNLTIMMSEETWEELGPELQTVMHEALDETIDGAIEAWLDRGDEMADYNADEVGGEFQDFSDLPADVQEQMEAGVEATWLEWIDTLDSQGQPGMEAALHWRDLVIANGGTVPEAIETLEEN